MLRRADVLTPALISSPALPSSNRNPIRQSPTPAADRRQLEPVIEGALRAPWRWNFSHRRIGGHRRRSQSGRDGCAPQAETRNGSKKNCFREDPESPRVASLERNLRNIGHLAEFALPSLERLASWPRSATWGNGSNALASWSARVLRKPAPCFACFGAARDERDSTGHHRGARDGLRGACARSTSPAAQSLRPRLRRQPEPARGRAFKVCSFQGWRSGSFPQKLREARCCSTTSAGAVGGDSSPRKIGRRPNDCCSGSRRCCRRRLWLSYRASMSPVRAAGTVVLRARRDARDHRPHSEHEVLQRAAATAVARSSIGPRRSGRKQASTTSNMTCRRCDCSLARRMHYGARAFHYLLGLTMRSAIGDEALGGAARSRWLAQDGLLRMTRPSSRCREAAAHRRLFRLGAPEVQHVPLSVRVLSAIYRLEPTIRPSRCTASTR